MSLNVPDRFEALREEASASLQTIIVPVEDGLAAIDRHFTDMRSARRGSLLIFQGRPGAGKSTFLDTVRLFRRDVVTVHVPADEEIPAALRTLQASAARILVLDGREATLEIGPAALEAAMHAINTFVRSDRGRDTLVVWPTNTDELTHTIVDIAGNIGAEALFGVEAPFIRFSGPPKSEFVSIAERTVSALNEGATLASLGISDERAVELVDLASTVGHYMALVRRESIQNGARVDRLLKSEPYRLWTLVVAGNEPEGDVAALTRGGFGYADIDRLMTATAANVVAELRKSPERVGLLGNMLDARIIYMDTVTISSVIRTYADEKLLAILKNYGVPVKQERRAAERLRASNLGVIISGNPLGVRKAGRRAGPDTRAFFSRLANISRQNDGLLNSALGRALTDAELITDFAPEKDLGTAMKVVTDLFCIRQTGDIRLEVMWRLDAGRADIASYVLQKLDLYGRATGLL